MTVCRFQPTNRALRKSTIIITLLLLPIASLSFAASARPSGIFLKVLAQSVKDSLFSMQLESSNSRADRTTALKSTATVTASMPQTRGGHRTVSSHEMAISAQESFAPKEDIAALTLTDIAHVFQYVRESNQASFQAINFVQQNQISDRCEKVLKALEDVVGRSRGGGAGTLESSVLPSVAAHDYGQVDALKFIAAMRLLAEWRLLRQVPEGYRSFAVGMNLGHKDIVHNAAKVERAVHEWIDYYQEERTPTLRQLLQHEIEIGKNPQDRLPHLNDSTGAMGLLWVCRQLQYQTRLLEYAAQIPSHKFSNSQEAALAAYQNVYNAYHSWAAQKMFSYSLSSAPDAEAIAKQMNPNKLKDVLDEAQHLKDSPDKQQSDTRMGNQAEEQQRSRKQSSLKGVYNFLTGRRQSSSLSSDDDSDDDADDRNDNHQLHHDADVPLEEYIRQKMLEDAYNQIAVYVQLVDPLLYDLDNLIEQLNMNDPTKV